MKVALIILTLILISACGSPDKSSKSKAQEILVTAKSCDEIRVQSISGGECSVDDFKTGSCMGQKECICVSPDKKIDFYLHSSVGNEFKFKFVDGSGDEIESPLKDNCLKKLKKDDAKCKIKKGSKLKFDVYDFMVKIKGCPNEHDPRIVINKLAFE